MEAAKIEFNGAQLELQQMWVLSGFPITIKKYEDCEGHTVSLRVSSLPYQFLIALLSSTKASDVDCHIASP